MKKTFLPLLLAFLACATAVTGQSVLGQFAGWANVTSVTGTGPYVITINSFNGNQRAFDQTWMLSDMAVGDILWSGTCHRYIVSSRIGLAITVTDPDPGEDGLPTNGQRISFVRETLVNGYALAPIPQFGDGNGGAIAGATNASAGCLIAHYEENTRLAIAAAGGGGGVSNLSYTASTGVVANTNGTGFTIPKATATVRGLFPGTSELEAVTASTSEQADATASTAAGLPFISVNGAGSKTLLFKK